MSSLHPISIQSIQTMALELNINIFFSLFEMIEREKKLHEKAKFNKQHGRKLNWKFNEITRKILCIQLKLCGAGEKHTKSIFLFAHSPLFFSVFFLLFFSMSFTFSVPHTSTSCGCTSHLCTCYMFVIEHISSILPEHSAIKTTA